MATSDDDATSFADIDATIPADTAKRTKGGAEIRKVKSLISTILGNLGGAVTATHTEINALAGSGVVLADLQKLAAITASSSEVNTLASSGISNADLVKLAAITAAAAEINTLASSGISNADLVKLAAINAAAADLNQLDGVSLLTEDQTIVSSSPVSASANTRYLVDSSGGAITVNLPAGAAGSKVKVVDYGGASATNNITVSPNGTEKVLGAAEEFVIDINHASVQFEYIDATKGWVLV